MYGCPEMESYEEFCLRSLATLQKEGKLKKRMCEPLCSLKTRSVIHFHGRPVLSPLLSAEQRSEMRDHRQRAVQLELERQNQQRNKLLAQFQNILDQAQVHTVLSEEVDKLPVSKPPTVSGYTLVTDSPGLPRDSGLELQSNVQPATLCMETPTFSDYKKVNEEKVERGEKSEEEEEEEEDISLDSLLKRSREYVKREQSQQGSKVVHTVTRTPLSETASDKENSPTGNTGVEFGFSLHHSPVSPPQTQAQHQTLYDPIPKQPGCLSPSLSVRYACLSSPQCTISPRAQKRRPRPVSTGNIHISFPIGPADLVPRSPRRSGEGSGVSDWGEALAGASKSSSHWGSLGSDDGDCASRSGNCRASHCGTTPPQEAYSPVSASVPSPMGHHDHLAAGFRRRCHTLDSQSHTCNSEHIDRSQERIPRFMAGVTWSAPGRRTLAAPLNHSYEVENPSPSLLRAHGTPDSAQVLVMLGPDEPQEPKSGKITSAVLRNATDAQTSKTAEETQRRAQALEDMQRRLEEEHALQMSLLLAEQEKEQQRLHLELEETERRLKQQGCVRPLSGDACDWNHRSVTECCPIGSPSCPGLSPAHTPSERSSGHSIGFPSPINSSVPSPSVQPPLYLWGPTWAASKPRARLSLVVTAEQQKAFCRIGALIRGFLTRRLLKTEKIKHLCQTVMDTQEFICSFQTEASQKKCSYSAQDLSLQERVRAQLRAARYDIHDIFFEMPLEDRLALLQQDRELRAERKLRDMEKTKCHKERVLLSAATQRSLDRKKKVGESPAQTRKMQQKPKSPTTNRVLKPSQGQNSPVVGQLNRQGSWYRKTPEERVRRSDSLKKQHSLG